MIPLNLYMERSVNGMFPEKLRKEPVSQPDYPVVKTQYGKLRGTQLEKGYIFRGIEYATAGRFGKPAFPASWEGIKTAVGYGGVCCEISTYVEKDAFLVPRYYYPQSENCQNLNVWTRHINAQEKRPVIVWLHGDGFSRGSAIERYANDGEELAFGEDAVVVTINHRLNVLGFLDLSSLGEEYGSCVNPGMEDIVKALEWIRDNISVFGGDPENVTVMGAEKVIALMQMPSADGLYKRGIIHSAAPGGRGLETEPQIAARMTELVLGNLSVKKEQAEELFHVPYYRLAYAAYCAENTLREQGIEYTWAPVYDGETYCGDPLKHGFRTESLSLPVIIGSCWAEYETNALNPLCREYGIDAAVWPDEIRKKAFREKYGDNAGKIADEFVRAYPGYDPVYAMFCDHRYRGFVLDYTRNRVDAGGKTYNFRFDMKQPACGGSFPWHNADIAYAFHNAKYMEPCYCPGASEALQDNMAHIWTSFAAHGQPQCADGMYWEPVSREYMPTMILDEGAYVEEAFDCTLIKLLRETEKKDCAAKYHPFGGGGKEKP